MLNDVFISSLMRRKEMTVQYKSAEALCLKHSHKQTSSLNAAVDVVQCNHRSLSDINFCLKKCGVQFRLKCFHTVYDALVDIFLFNEALSDLSGYLLSFI